MNERTLFKPRLTFDYQDYAMTEEKSAYGRIEKEEPYLEVDSRTEFQHDRDRIIHAKAFRRMESKTQVAISHESDHNRKRLTHSLEVAQISESIAIILGLNTFLTCAIALGHDLGHTPFGHGGEKVLDGILKDLNMKGFKHNYQSILVVNKLEKRANGGNGLNLMWETRDGILKHTSLKGWLNVADYDAQLSEEPKFPVTLEGQIVRIVDEIAQRTHDTDDGLRSNRIKVKELVEEPVVLSTFKFANINEEDIINSYEKDEELVRAAIVRSMIKYYVYKLLKNTLNNIEKRNIRIYDDVLKQDIQIVDFDEDFRKKDETFADTFLRPRFYNHYEIKRMDSRAGYFIIQLFKAFKKNPRQLHEKTYDEYINAVRQFLEEEKGGAMGKYKTDLDGFPQSDKLKCKNTCSYIPEQKIITKEQVKKCDCPLRKNNKPACEGMRVIVNHIAGMTDRYTHLEYSRLYFPPEISRM